MEFHLESVTCADAMSSIPIIAASLEAATVCARSALDPLKKQNKRVS